MDDPNTPPELQLKIAFKILALYSRPSYLKMLQSLPDTADDEAARGRFLPPPPDTAAWHSGGLLPELKRGLMACVRNQSGLANRERCVQCRTTWAKPGTTNC